VFGSIDGDALIIRNLGKRGVQCFDYEFSRTSQAPESSLARTSTNPGVGEFEPLSTFMKRPMGAHSYEKVL